MSADNGIYILHCEADGNYRVANTSASVMGELGSHWMTPEDEQQFLISTFNKVFDCWKDASIYACRLELSEDTEYGICEEFLDYPFGTLRDQIPVPPLPEGACIYCSHPGSSTVYHGTGLLCDRDPNEPIFIVREALREAGKGINHGYLARLAVEALKEAGKL